jgi:hypothetical protein
MVDEKKILVFYIGVAGIRSEDLQDFVYKVSSRITPSTFEGEIIMIPTQGSETRVECVNPVYITDEELIKKHTDLMQELQLELRHQVTQLKENSNE